MSKNCSVVACNLAKFFSFETEDMADGEADWENEDFEPTIVKKPILHTDRWEGEDEDEDVKDLKEQKKKQMKRRFYDSEESELIPMKITAKQDSWDDEEEDTEEELEQSCKKRALTLDRASFYKPWCKHMFKGNAMDSSLIQRSLCRAASLGHLDEMKLLVSQSADVNLEDGGEDTPLMHFVRTGCLEALDSWDDEEEDTEEELEQSCEKKAFTMDRASSNKPWCKHLVKGNAVVFSWIQLALCHAASLGHLEKMKFLVSQGADVNLKDEGGDTPLMHAVESGNLEAVKFLVRSGADVNYYSDRLLNPLLYSESLRNLDIIEFLISKEADVNPKSNDATALHYAAWFASVELVKYLVKDGADVNARDKEGATPLYNAISSGNLESVVFLLDHGAKIDVKNQHGETPIHCAVIIRNNEVHDFITCSSVWERHDEVSKTSFDIVMMLINQGAKLGAINEDGNTPDHAKVHDKNMQICKYLSNLGENLPPFGTWYPHHDAHYQGFSKIIRLLLDRGADVNAENEDGESALYLASNQLCRDALQEVEMNA